MAIIALLLAIQRLTSKSKAKRQRESVIKLNDKKYQEHSFPAPQVCYSVRDCEYPISLAENPRPVDLRGVGDWSSLLDCTKTNSNASCCADRIEMAGKNTDWATKLLNKS